MLKKCTVQEAKSRSKKQEARSKIIAWRYLEFKINGSPGVSQLQRGRENNKLFCVCCHNRTVQLTNFLGKGHNL
jgi:hypothetical protein